MSAARLASLTYEMGIVAIIDELIGLRTQNTNLDLILSDILEDSSSSDEEDEYWVFLIKQAQQGVDDERMMILIRRIFLEISHHPDQILRPYQSHFRTDSGENRILSIADLSSKFGVEARRVLRFSVDQLEELIVILEIPAEFVFSGHKTTGVEALTIALHRLASHARFCDLSYVFDLLPSFLSQVFAGFMLWIYDKYGANVRSFEHPWTMEREWMELFSSKLTEKGCPLANCFGFIDGTHIEVCRPVRNQRAFYCGHHHCHCFKSLVIQLPNGIMLAFGPFNGSQHDSSQAQEVQINNLLATNCSFPDRDFVLYADSGFAVGQNIITPFRRGRNQTAGEAEWNREMSSARITVEWGIGRVKQLFQLMTNKNNLRCLMSPVAVYWFNSIFFTNVHTCINRRCQVSDYFGLSTPTLEEYLAS